MILRDCKKGMVFLPPDKTRLPVKVVTEEERIILYFKTYRLQDCRQLMQVDFYDLSQGLLVTASEVLIRRNPGYPNSSYPWIGICEIREVKRIIQRQHDVRVGIQIEALFEKESGRKGSFFATIRNISAGGMYIETAEELHQGEAIKVSLSFERTPRELHLAPVWVKKAENGRFGYGLRFWHLSTGVEAEIRNYVFRLINAKREKAKI